ncbi:class A sortase [Enterococcus faecium]|uniref:class A sortase n=1 Tax=Enterococcus faecium TaxID=1352 RepID=UPI0015615812|nr:class A sortase [Enterococcus faecium]NRE65548.1 class A sortase [Enterococcus faecium]NTQ95201.1 class A sortase [Enterococcus faecium]HCC6682896.1 class A sortase [Enterococcus faecium]
MKRFFIQYKKRIIASLLGLLFLCGMGSYFYFTMKEQTMNQKTGTLQSEAVQKMQEKEQFQQKSGTKEKRQEADTTSKPDQTQLPTTIDKTKVDYSGKDVKPLTVEEMEKVDADNIISSFGVGTLSIPSIHMELPILEGVSQSNLSVGAGTMKPNQIIGKGNFALAGHYMTDSGLLFGGLKNVKTGDQVSLTYENQQATYQVNEVKKISENDGYVIEDTEGNGILTLITCDSSVAGTDGRLMVRANLID